MISMPSATVRCGRSRAAMGGAIAAEAIRSTAMGTNARPALVGEKPRMFWRYSEVKK